MGSVGDRRSGSDRLVIAEKQDKESGCIIEGAPNIDVDTGLLQAFASNSAALFRNPGVNSTTIPDGEHTYINALG